MAGLLRLGNCSIAIVFYRDQSILCIAYVFMCFYDDLVFFVFFDWSVSLCRVFSLHKTLFAELFRPTSLGRLVGNVAPTQGKQLD